MNRLIKYLIFASAFCISANYVLANEVTVYGTITKKDNAPLTGAKVSFISETGDTISTYADEKGEYSIVLMYYTDVSNKNPDIFTLGQNFPNPFNPSTAIEFSLANHLM